MKQRETITSYKKMDENKKKTEGTKGGGLRRNVKRGFYKGDACVKGLKAGVITSRGEKTWLGQKREEGGDIDHPESLFVPR